ncbi:MAG: hypothetical protein HFI64_15035 [Lachnospiraceae bacterium]|nr:hypothetical protein [Lachnospiraceae bacterium]
MTGKYKYTVFSLLFTVLFILGSMAAVNYFLRVREARLLAESGRAEVEAPVLDWEEWGRDPENAVAGDADDGRRVLTTKQMEEAVESWEGRTEVILHDPVAGQISMEEAIENGERWLDRMKMGGETDAASFSISAKLGVGGQRETDGGRLEACFSFWTVTYSNPSMNAVLYLNAVTGKVWGAQVVRYEELPEENSEDGLRLFVTLAGLQAADGDSVVTDSGGTRTEMAIKESRLYAQEHSYSMAVGFESSYAYTAYRLFLGQE